MNSKELLEQATVKIEKMNDLMASIDVIETTLSAATKPETMIAFFEPSLGAIGIRYILTDNVMEDIKNTALKEIQKVRHEKSVELGQLLGIQDEDKPKIINPEFVEAVENKVKPPFKADHITSIDGIPKYIDKESDKSLDKYPAKKKAKKSPYPDNMTPDLVRKMYVDEGKTLKQVAEHFGIKPTQVNGFLQRHSLFRGSYNKDFTQKQPDKVLPKPVPLRAQNDIEKCRICGKELQFSAKMTREMWPYKYVRKRNSEEQIVYACDREHFYAGKTKDA